MEIKYKNEILIGIKVLIVCFIIIIVTFIGITNIASRNMDFNNLYAEVEEILNQNPQKTNGYKDNIVFYQPKGYKFMSDSYIMTKNEMYIELIPEHITVDNENYTINKDKELIFQKESLKDQGINMSAWLENERYDILLTKNNGYAVTGNFNEKDISQGIIDMANILSTLKIKEIK